MNLILLTGMSILMTVISDVIVLIFKSLGVAYNIECDMAGLKLPPLANS